jgi:hypothetical protein
MYAKQILPSSFIWQRVFSSGSRHMHIFARNALRTGKKFDLLFPPRNLALVHILRILSYRSMTVHISTKDCTLFLLKKVKTTFLLASLKCWIISLRSVRNNYSILSLIILIGLCEGGFGNNFVIVRSCVWVCLAPVLTTWRLSFILFSIEQCTGWFKSSWAPVRTSVGSGKFFKISCAHTHPG